MLVVKSFIHIYTLVSVSKPHAPPPKWTEYGDLRTIMIFMWYVRASVWQQCFSDTLNIWNIWYKLLCISLSYWIYEQFSPNKITNGNECGYHKLCAVRLISILYLSSNIRSLLYFFDVSLPQNLQQQQQNTFDHCTVAWQWNKLVASVSND